MSNAEDVEHLNNCNRFIGFLFPDIGNISLADIVRIVAFECRRWFFVPVLEQKKPASDRPSETMAQPSYNEPDLKPRCKASLFIFAP
jgi:hypothetical protein